MSKPDRLPIIRRGPGSIQRLAEHLGLTSGAVAKWRQVPADRVVKVAKFLGVSRHALRPDLYPEPEPDNDDCLRSSPDEAAA